VATQFFFTLCFVGMLLAIAMVLMYLLCIDDYYRVKVLRWTGVDLLVSGASIILSRIPKGGFFFGIFLFFTLLHLPPLRFHCVGGC
jgi:hypothetical protein